MFARPSFTLLLWLPAGQSCTCSCSKSREIPPMALAWITLDPNTRVVHNCITTYKPVMGHVNTYRSRCIASCLPLPEILGEVQGYWCRLNSPVCAAPMKPWADWDPTLAWVGKLVPCGSLSTEEDHAHLQLYHQQRNKPRWSVLWSSRTVIPPTRQIPSDGGVTWGSITPDCCCKQIVTTSLNV